MKSENLLKFVKTVLPVISQVTITGQENVPRTGAVIFAINHLGILDAPLGYMGVNRPDATGWVADKHLTNPLYSFLVRSVDGVWINREIVDMQALRRALQVLKEGRLFGVAPEGTRSPTGAMVPAKEGASYLAFASGAPIVPAGLTGTENAGRDWKRLRRPVITLNIGKPFTLPALDRNNRQEQMAQGTDEIMCRIATLIPPEYRGVYADHPRLKELLAGSS
jgi:1-acyl-sn-glycerol-3-phosphate acyltransferase